MTPSGVASRPFESRRIERFSLKSSNKVTTLNVDVDSFRDLGARSFHKARAFCKP